MSYWNGICHISLKNQIKEDRCFIGFENFRIRCVIGIYPEERSTPQEIYVDLKVALDISKDICTPTGPDSLKNTVDYTVLAEQCAAIAKKNKYYLLEAYASDALDEIFSHKQILWGWIRVKKPTGLSRISHTISNEDGRDDGPDSLTIAQEYYPTDKATAIVRDSGLINRSDSLRECEKSGLLNVDFTFVEWEKYAEAKK